MCDLEMVVALLEHFPELHVRRIAVPGHVNRRHPKRKRLDLERFLAARKRFSGEGVDFRDLLVGHRITPARGTVAVDHEKGAGTPVRPIVDIREPGIDREIVVGVRIHQAGGDGVEALRRLPVALLDLGSKLSRPAADRVGAKECEPP